MEDWLQRTELLIGKKNLEQLRYSTVVVFGCGGVGSFVVEGLVRAGIGNLILFDPDIISITNLNRQIMATVQTIGESKVQILKQRALQINPALNIRVYSEFVTEENIDSYLRTIPAITYLVDAVDIVSSKLAIIQYAHDHKIPLISCMGTGNKIDPTRFEITDIQKTSVCPLAKVIRKELRNRKIPHLKVLYSKESPNQISPNSTHSTASISFVPSVAGLMIAGEVVKDICMLS